jgi:NAD(P)H-flavin reductase
MATTINKTTAATSNPWLPMAARITAITSEVPGISTYALQFEDASIASDYRFLPGQFNMLYLPGFGEAAISISSDPDQPNSLAHTVRVAGNVTRALSRMQVGQQLLLRGRSALRGRLTSYSAVTSSSPAAVSAWRRYGR